MKLEYKIMAAFGLLLVAVVSAIAVIGRTDRPIEPELVIPLTSKVKGDRKSTRLNSSHYS